MSKINTVKFTGGLNVDAENRDLPEGDYKLPTLNLRNGLTSEGGEGAATNVFGNTLITTYNCPYNGFNGLPAGTNETLGYLEDAIENTVIYMAWNSAGHHGIYRYYPNKTDVNNPIGIVEQVMQFNFGWDRNERITSLTFVPSQDGNLLYWIDSTGLRKINLDKGNINNKQKSWTIYAPQTNQFTNVGLFDFQLKDFAGTLIVNASIPIFSTYPNNAAGLQYIAGQINANYSATLTAEACDCKIILTEKGTNSYDYALNTTGFQLLLAPLNWYGSKFAGTNIDSLITIRTFDRVKYASLTNPIPIYKQDPLYLPNNVKDKVFQFCNQYYHDDFEQSVFSVYSNIALNNLQCDGSSNILYNYIDVNFNDEFIINNLNIIKKIAFIAREHNTGDWKRIIILEPCDFLDYVNGAWICHYNFYNDIVSDTVDTVTAGLIESGVPITAKAETQYLDRITTGGIELGRDAPDCAEGSYQITMAPAANVKLYKTKFKIRVLSWMLGTNPAENEGPFDRIYPDFRKSPFWESNNADVNYTLQRGIIGHDVTRTTNNFAFFGGGGFSGNAGSDFNTRAGMEDTYDQRIPEGGWPVYFAGTPFFGISKQVNIGLPTDGKGALDTSTTAYKTAIGTHLVGPAGGGPSADDLYSEVTIYAPAGEYVVRLASHWCSFGVDGVDKLGKGYEYDLNGKSWRQTSTNVWGVYSGGTGITPPMYFPGAFEFSKEIKIVVTADNDDAGTFIVADLAPPFFIDPSLWVPLNAYLYDDSDGTTADSDPNSLQFSGVAVEKTMIAYEQGQDYTTTPLTSYSVTDHNGYFFGIGGGASVLGGSKTGFGFCARQVNNQNLTINNTILWQGSLTDLFEKRLSAYDYGANATKMELQYGVVTTSLNTGRTSCSTFITGKVVDQNGQALPDALVVYQNGEVFITDVNGKYNIIVWGDILTPNIPGFILADSNLPSFVSFVTGTNRIVDSLIINISPLCNVTYPNGQEIGPINLSAIAANTLTQSNVPPFSPTSIFLVVPDFVVNEAQGNFANAFKRGGKEIHGIRYLDEQGRVSPVSRLYEMYTPFLTEDLSKYSQVVDPNTGLPYTAPTYIGGVPTTKWFLGNYKPPVYAAYYQIMRTKNTIYGRYLQWVANEVIYLSKTATPDGVEPEVQTAYQNSNAVAIKISISNIIDYGRVNINSQIGYNYEAGDRLRLINNRDVELIQGLYDLEITSYDPVSASVYVKSQQLPFEILSGFTIEIYNAKTIASEDEQIFYEMGEVFKCTNPGQPNNAHSVTSGTFRSGDAYWRGRLIEVADSLTGFTATYPVIIEDASVSDFYPSQDSGIGRIGIIDPNLKQIFYPARLAVSNIFQADTAYNGLSIYGALNTNSMGNQYGEVQRIVMVGKILHAVMKNNNVSNYIGIVTLKYSQSNQGVQAISDNFLGTENPSLSTLGTDFPASLSIVDSYIYALDSLRKSFWRHSENGPIEISRNSYSTIDPVTRSEVQKTRMVNYFRDLCANGVWDAISIVDKRYKECILTAWPTISVYGTALNGGINFTNNPDLRNNLAIGDEVIIYYTDANGIAHQVTTTLRDVAANAVITPAGFINGPVKMDYKGIGQTIAWNEEKNRWTTPYAFVPECYAALGDDIYSFKNGQIWKHDSNPVRNNFYGVQTVTQVTSVFNNEPQKVKTWLAHTLTSLQEDKGNNWSAPVISNDRGQLSRFLKGVWKKIEEFWFAGFKMDLTDVSVTNPIVNGRPMKSSSLVVTLENDATVGVKLYEQGASYVDSERTGR